MTQSQTDMAREAAQAADAVRRQQAGDGNQMEAIARSLRDRPPPVVLTCARGSSDHAATYAKYLIETLIGIPVSSAAPSTASIYGRIPQAQGALCIAISQSGASPDLLASVRAAKSGGARTLALVNAAASPLADLADHVVPLEAGPERSVAATKSYIASLARIAELVAAWSNDASLNEALAELPDQLQAATELDWSALVDELSDARGLYVIGRGVGLGAAQEAALKLKETCGLHAEAFSSAEVLHGPMAIITEAFPLLVFRQEDATAKGIDDVITTMLDRGARIRVAGKCPDQAISLPTIPTHPALQPIVQIQSFYGAVNALSLRRGFDPDRPPHLKKVTQTT